MREIAAVLLLSLPAVVWAQQGPRYEYPVIQYRGAGVASCGKWVEWRALAQEHALRVGAESWVMGFLNGAADATSTDILKQADSSAIYLWLDNYCKTNPLKPVMHGASALYWDLKKETQAKR